MKCISVLTFLFLFSLHAVAQVSFVTEMSDEFKNERPRNGIGRYYFLSPPTIWERVDSSLKEQNYGFVLLCVEGEFKNGLKENIFTAYMIDSADHSKRYKVWEQTYKRNKLNGEWRVYNLAGKFIYVFNCKEDSLSGLARRFHNDGIRTLEEREYVNGRAKFLVRKFDDTGRVEREMWIENKKPNGPGKSFYKNGKLKEEVFLVDGKMHGLRKYFHSNGQVWSEVEYKDGKPWNLISNYSDKGVSVDGGNLKDGNGTTKLYNADGTLREIRNYVEGKQVKKR